MEDIKFINTNKEKFIKGPGKEKTHIFKYMPIKHILASFNKSYLHLVHPSQWKDPYETRFIDAEYTGFMQDDNILNNIYCTCFNQSVISSEAHWNTYTNDHLCGRLVIDRGDLYEKLKKYLVDYDIYIAYIEYKKAYNGKGIEKSLWGKANGNFEDLILRLLSIKRRPYAYEEECRVYFIPKNKKVKAPESIKIEEFNWLDITSKIYIDPNVDKNVYEMIKSYFKDKYPTIKIARNTLYEKPDKLLIHLENNELTITKEKLCK